MGSGPQNADEIVVTFHCVQACSYFGNVFSNALEVHIHLQSSGSAGENTPLAAFKVQVKIQRGARPRGPVAGGPC